MVNFLDEFADLGGYSPFFEAGVHIPTLDTNPLAIMAWLQASDFQIYNNVYCSLLRVELHKGIPPEVELHAQIHVEFEKNQVLTGQVWGKVVAGVSAKLEGKLQKDWDNAFGVSGLTLTEVGLSVGVSLNRDLDLVSGLGSIFVGVACELKIGTTAIYLTGRGGMTTQGLPDKSLLLYGALRGAGADGFGLAISMRDVATWWVEEILGERDGVIWGFDPMDIPEDWGLYDSFFQLSTGEVEMFGEVYPAGFSFSTGLSIFGIDCSVVMAVVDKEVGDGMFVPDMEFQIKEGLEAAEELSRRKLMEEIL